MSERPIEAAGRGRGVPSFGRCVARWARRRLGGDRGMVTAEIAVALPALVAVLAVAIGAVTAVTGQLRCVDAAREGARAAARGESRDDVIRVATSAAPSGASVAVTTSSDQVTVVVSAEVPLAGGLLPAVDVSASAVALAEPTGAVPPAGGSGPGGEAPAPP